MHSGAFPSASRPSGTVVQCYPFMVLFCLASTWAHYWLPFPVMQTMHWFLWLLLWWRERTKTARDGSCVLSGYMSLALVEKLVSYLIDTRAYSVPYRSRFWGMHLCTTVGALDTLPRIYFGRMVRRTTFLYSRRLLACSRSRSSRRSWSS